MIRTTEGWVPNEATDRVMSRVRMEDFVTGIDWEREIGRFAPLPELPDYVRSSIHGIEGGYSEPFAAATWDGVVRQIFAEYIGEETGYRDLLPSMVESSPKRILDVACGTGESTLGWRRRFHASLIVAVDVSPYMVVVASSKLENIADLRCADAEQLPFDDGTFDLVTASLLFHELPSDAASNVLVEMRRVVKNGGEIAIAEPYRMGGTLLKPIPFPEPYLREFLATDWDRALNDAGFVRVREHPIENGWIRTARAA